jgi:hypothetical protein
MMRSEAISAGRPGRLSAAAPGSLSVIGSGSLGSQSAAGSCSARPGPSWSGAT